LACRMKAAQCASRRRLRMGRARPEVDALTSALQRCLARGAASLELQRDALALGRGLQQLLARGVKAVVSHTARGSGGIRGTSSGRAAARTTQPSDMRMCAPSTKRTGLLEVVMGVAGRGPKAKGRRSSGKQAQESKRQNASASRSRKARACQAKRECAKLQSVRTEATTAAGPISGVSGC